MNQRLRSSTDDAMARGAFGVPTFDVDGELFWGQDALGHVERWLMTEEQWSGITATATRPGSL